MSSDLDELLKLADDMVSEAEPELVPVKLAKRAVGVRFLPMSGEGWRDLILQHPPRPEIMQDTHLGYNIDAVAEVYPDVALVIEDHVDDMIRDGKSVWPAVWKRLTATGRKDVAQAMWVAHEVAPEQVVVVAGKASSGERKKKRS